MIGVAVTGAAAFVAMEPLTCAAHRWIMHGLGWAWHRSHHRASAGADPRRGRDRLEANDLFPVLFAALTILAMAAGTLWPSLGLLVAAGVGVTVYGVAYALVHDVYIHGRLGRLPEIGLLEHLRAAHAIHHRFGRQPYGMLWPMVPAQLRQRASRLVKA